MKKFLATTLVLILVVILGTPVMAVPPDHYYTRQTVCTAMARWENFEESEAGFMQESWNVWIEPMDNIFYLSVSYHKESLIIGDPKDESDDIWEYEENSFDTELTPEQFNLTSRTMGNDLTINVGPVNVTWEVLALHDIRTKLIQRQDNQKFQLTERGTLAECEVYGELFGTVLNSETTRDSIGKMSIGIITEKLIS